MDFCEVYFCTNRTKIRPFLWNLDWWKCVAIRWCSMSVLCHVSIGYDGVVLNPTIKGNFYFSRDSFIAHYPTLCAVFIVPVRYGIDLSFFEYGVGVRKPSWPTFRRWIAGGGPWNEDCLCIALACLQAAGVDAPPNTCTTAGLYRWLCHKGTDHVSDLAGRNGPGLRIAARQFVADCRSR